VHPIRHPVYGVPGFEPGISRVELAQGAGIVEFPVSTWTLLGRNFPVGGGGYFRLLPGAVSRAALRSIARERPLCFYLHPWEFDPDQPRVSASPGKRFRHYLNLSRTLPRLEALLASLPFGTMQEVLREQGWLGSAGAQDARGDA
jgi:hypothetical protein